MSLKNIIDMLEFSQDPKDENIQIAKGKYKYPYSIREIFRMKKRHLKYREENGKGKNG